LLGAGALAGPSSAGMGGAGSNSASPAAAAANVLASALSVALLNAAAQQTASLAVPEHHGSGRGGPRGGSSQHGRGGRFPEDEVTGVHRSSMRGGGGANRHQSMGSGSGGRDYRNSRNSGGSPGRHRSERSRFNPY
jgi:hypothetical protein